MKLWHAFFIVINILCTSPSIAAPITFNTVLPVSKDELIIRNQLIINRASDSGVSQKTSSLVSTLAYGATQNLTFFATLPLIDRTLKTPDGRFSNSGLGDVQLIARFTTFQKNSAGKTFRIAPFLGAKIPTGDEDRNNTPSVALSTGSTDLFTGLITTYATTNWTVDGQLAYRNNGSSNGTEFGDAFTFDTSLQYRLIPRQLKATSTAFLNGVLELNIVDQQSNTRGGTNDENSGGTSIFIAPGLQYITQRWILESSVQIPIQTNNSLLENDYIAQVGIRTNF